MFDGWRSCVRTTTNTHLSEMLTIRWLPQETDWFMKVSPDHVRHLGQGGAAGPFIDKLALAFLCQFLYCHVCTVEHSEHTAEEGEHALWGESFWGLHEGLRHKMNMVKPAKYKKIKLGKTKIVLPKPSGLLQMDETNVMLHTRLSKQGYLEADKKSPYSRDTELQELTERLVSRLHMWPDVDFAASTDGERKMLLKDLPGDMNDLAWVLLLHTGAEIAIFGTWKTARGCLTVHR
ncbi:hypothetical protein FRC08_001404 [Ceratobasidium sp. 394]|nr:hypothetical protein FRC08_001404 [Ceratobasidium sp. 394]